MELLIPVQTADNMLKLCESGIREFYCGYLTEEWIERFNKKHGTVFSSVQISINRRDAIQTNVRSKSELTQMVKIAKRYDARLFLTVNAPFYPKEASDAMNHYLTEIIEAGIRKLIAADIGFIRYVHDQYPELGITISCENQILNSSAVLFYQQFTPERMVLPRHISIPEIKTILQNNPDMEFECFLLSNKCIYDDGNCRCMHDLGNICTDIWKCEHFPVKSHIYDIYKYEEANTEFDNWSFNYNRSRSNRMKFWNDFGCSICSLYNLVLFSNMKSLKVVGRGKIIQYEDISFLSKAVEMAESGCSLKALQEYAKEQYGYEDMCNTGKYCIMRGI